nr:MAG TPA: Small Terminase [Caudoviricetes sp.]
MPKPRSPDADKRSDERKAAEKLYLDSKGEMKLVDIARKLGLPDNKVRKWKSLDAWEAKLHPASAEKGKKKPVERSTKEKGSVPPKRGAPEGNKNAVGNKGNPNPTPPPDMTKHGGYSSVYWDTLDEDEKELIDDMPKDEEALLIEQIQLFSVRERRIMKAINKYRTSESPVAIAFTQRSERKRSFAYSEEEAEYNRTIEEKVANGDRLPGKEYSVFTQTDNKDQIIARLESELSNIQSKKTKAIEALSKMHLEKQKLEGGNKGNDVVKSWAEKVLKMREGQNG